ncbi:MAG: acylphosphatase [Atopobiaceae bacterium]|nr:acylphosphatase [Atopobiaceae bacterium]
MAQHSQDPGISRIRYHFVGRVQNRGFRYACIQCARRTGVTGWVRNERDGSVIAEVQGPVSARSAWLHRLEGIVHGFGDQWSIGSAMECPVIPDEERFTVAY